MQCVRRLTVVAVIASAFGACDGSRSLDPATLPWTFVEAGTEYHPTTPIDFDSDGRDEFAIAENRGTELNSGVVSLFNSDEALVDQFRFDGRVMRPHGLDTDGDGVRELLMPFVRRDSLFVTVGDAQGNKLTSFFLVAGAPRVEPDGVLAWDPQILLMEVRRSPESADRELVTLVTTGLARAPRGIVVNSLRTGERVGEWLTGAQLPIPARIDVDRDGHDEWFFATSTSDNGAVAGGQNDRESYVLLVRIHPVPSLMWSRRVGGLPSGGSGLVADADGDGRVEPVAFIWSADSSRVETLDPMTGRSRSVRYRPPLAFVQPIDASADHTQRYVGRNTDLGLELVDIRGTELGRTPSTLRLGVPQYVGDLDGDGRREFIANFGTGTIAALDEDLTVLAAGARGFVHHNTAEDVIREPGSPLRMRLSKSRGETAHVEVTMVRNRGVLLQRARPWLLPTATLSLFLLIILRMLHFRRLARTGAPPRSDESRTDVWKLTSRQIAHDFKGPLNRVQGRLDHMRLEYAEADPDLVAKLDEQRSGIQEQIRRLTRRTDNFLKFVDVVEPTRALVELNEIVRESLSSFEPVRARGIEVDLDLASTPVELYADRDQLHSLVENLVQNAVDAVGARGRITVATRLASGLPSEDGGDPTDHVVLEVRDTGEGMIPAVRQRIFEVGYSGSGRSSGLGLAIVHKFVSAQGGRIDVDSEPGLGTVFTIYLPAA